MHAAVVALSYFQLQVSVDPLAFVGASVHSELEMSYHSLDTEPSSSSASNPQKRLKLTIKPLHPKPTPPIQGTGISPVREHGSFDTPTSFSSTPKLKAIKLKLSNSAAPTVETSEAEKPRPKIRIKPPRPKVEDVVQIEESESMDVDPNTPNHLRHSLPPMTASENMEVDTVEPASVTEGRTFEPFFQPPPPQRSKRAPLPPRPKIPRPIKLKPLKEVLIKLIGQIKKKDDYAFFLAPVDTTQVSNYADVVKNPMDFGTMSEKVDRGKYRSLDQFKEDFCLVTSNAKAFNPPGTLYHVEASKIESWGLEQIKRVSSQVIEFESEWNLDAAPTPEPTEAIEEPPLTEVSSRARSPSVMSSTAGPSAPQHRKSRSKKSAGVTETWEEGWHLPGFKDGLSAFRPGSEFASLMLELKLRGKRFRSKKERLRREKEGPPYLTDGSLDFSELDHPFSAFQSLAPQPLKPPNITRLLAKPTSMTSIAQFQSQSIAGTPAPEPARLTDNVSDFQGISHVQPQMLSSLVDAPDRHIFLNPQLSTQVVGEKKLKHWTITRNPPRPVRANQDDEENVIYGQNVQRSEASHSDYGAFASLLGVIAAERGQSIDDFEVFFGSHEKILAQIRSSIQNDEVPLPSDNSNCDAHTEQVEISLSDDYLREIVYGGVDGLAYFRSIAEFIGEYRGPVEKNGQDLDSLENDTDIDMPLAQWVVANIVDPLTDGNHATLRAASATLARAASADSAASQAVARYAALAKQDKSSHRALLNIVQEISEPTSLIDIAPILHAPGEMFEAEAEWFGRQERGPATAETRDVSSRPFLDSEAPAIEHTRKEFFGKTEPGQEAATGTDIVPQTAGSDAAEAIGAVGNEMSMALAVGTALRRGAEVLEQLGRKTAKNEEINTMEGVEDNIDTMKRRVRMNLIALAKRAPIHQIAPLPEELVPPHIRHLVPTRSAA